MARKPITPDSPGSIGGNGFFGSGSSYVPTSSSDSDITKGLYDDLQLQASGLFDHSDEDTAKANYLNWILTQNQRQFDTNWRDNEREYTSPQQQLQRLMATGMSYSAALALLSGTGEAGSASGLAQPTMAAADSSKDVANGINATSVIGSLFLGGLSSALGFVQSFALNRQQIALLKSQALGQDFQNQISSRYLEGQITADGVAGTINHAISTGSWTPAESDYATSQSFLKAAFDNGVITDSQLSSIYSSVPASDAFSDHFNKNWSTQGVKISSDLYDDAFNAFKAQQMISVVSLDMTKQELDNMRQSYKNLVAEYGSIEAQTENYKSSTALNKQKTRESQAVTQAQQIENTIRKPVGDAYMQYAKEVTQAARGEILTQFAKWTAYAGNADKLKKQIDKDFANGLISSDLAAQMLTFMYQSYQALNDTTTNYSQSELAAFSLARDFSKYYEKHCERIVTKDSKGASTNLGVGVGAAGTGANAGLGVETSGETTVEKYVWRP